jgi:hypothetical protein
MTRPARFTSADLERAVKAMEKAGVCLSRVRIAPDGSIELIVGDPDKADNGNWFAGSPLYRDVA